ncbi:hypothetical protein M0L20_23710 [Spirosoma sp. RP8]|uniref:Glycosyltransferase family 1 protein n=1 Tax=Spirosoma liriopis TaxID=2937440 RepID=A0ABT0HRT1_9BACT|nr:hypothetical protein [Spirosoma liriopis]MCK8494897.1 hypothetical protein [Spirosoma liriopis]
MPRVYIDPRANIEYSAFYIKGLYDLFGRTNVRFNQHYFSELPDDSNLNFVVQQDNIIIRYTIDYNDVSAISQVAYCWCDCYGKINLRAGLFEDDQQKIVNIPPSFGIRIWALIPTLWLCFVNMLRTGLYSKRFVSGYAKQIRHLPITEYSPGEVKPDYAFSFNTLWNSDEWIRNDETVNQKRYNFYKVVTQQSGLNNEVGFIYSTKRNLNPLFQSFVTDKWLPKTEYLAKTKQSVLVFNTPAWDLCHGWKLAEYLALGKAIITTPLVNELPFELINGKHVHFVLGSEGEIRQAVEHVLSDTTYRESLEQGARQYYLDYVQPRAVLQRLLTKHLVVV